MQLLHPDMDREFSFCIRFSGLTVRFILPTSVNLPDSFKPLICEDIDNPTAEYKVCLLNTPLCPETEPIAKEGDTYIYVNDKGCLRIYSALTADDGCQVACFLCPNGKNILYYPAKMWDIYRKHWHCTHLLAGEALLLTFDSILLHSSLVKHNGKMLLFCGASGAGKSTQANLWQKYKNAEIINGDRAVIRKIDKIFCAGGSLWCGTSGINKGDIAPIIGIFIIKQAKTNKIRQIKKEALLPLLTQTTINYWDSDFVNKVTNIYDGLLESVPIYELECTADKNAVELVYDTICIKETLNEN